MRAADITAGHRLHGLSRRRLRSSVSSLLFVRRASDMKDVEANLLENPVFADSAAAGDRCAGRALSACLDAQLL